MSYNLNFWPPWVQRNRQYPLRLNCQWININCLILICRSFTIRLLKMDVLMDSIWTLLWVLKNQGKHLLSNNHLLLLNQGKKELKQAKRRKSNSLRFQHLNITRIWKDKSNWITNSQLLSNSIFKTILWWGLKLFLII